MKLQKNLMLMNLSSRRFFFFFKPQSSDALVFIEHRIFWGQWCQEEGDPPFYIYEIVLRNSPKNCPSISCGNVSHQ